MSLFEIMEWFPDREACNKFLEGIRFQDGLGEISTHHDVRLMIPLFQNIAK